MLESEFEFLLESEFECGCSRSDSSCLRCIAALEFDFESSHSSSRAFVRVSGFAFQFESEFKCLR